MDGYVTPQMDLIFAGGKQFQRTLAPVDGVAFATAQLEYFVIQ